MNGVFKNFRKKSANCESDEKKIQEINSKVFKISSGLKKIQKCWEMFGKKCKGQKKIKKSLKHDSKISERREIF